jgi:hypothetical protein
MKLNAINLYKGYAIAFLIGVALLAGCSQTGDSPKAQATSTAAFSYDQAALPGKKTVVIRELQ